MAGWDKSVFGAGYRTEPIKPGQPRCSHCNGILYSSVVNFGDPMPENDYRLSCEHAKKADVFLIIGSSLVVYPAADLPIYAMENGARVVLINIGETPIDNEVDIKIEEKIGPILTSIIVEIRKYNQRK